MQALLFYHYLKRNAAFIDTRLINNTHYNQVYESYMSNKLEAEAHIYNQVLDLEAIELHKLITIIQDNKGVVLDLNTDAVNCVFPNNIPFELDDKLNIKGYYYDEEQTMHRYKMEIKNDRLKVERLPGTKRNDYYCWLYHIYSHIYISLAPFRRLASVPWRHWKFGFASKPSPPRLSFLSQSIRCNNLI